MSLVLLFATLALAGDGAATCTADGAEVPCPEATALQRELTEGTGRYLLTLAHGDGCPTMYQVVCLVDGKHTEAFGNCSDFSSVTTTGEATVFHFAADAEAGRKAARFAFSGDRSCKVKAMKD